MNTLTRVVTAALGRPPAPRVAGGQLLNVGQTVDLQRIMRDTSSRWHAEAHRWIRTNGTLGQSVRYLGSRASRVNWRPERREGGRWVPDNDPFAHHFADSLVTLDQVRLVELLEGIGVGYVVVDRDDAHGLRWSVYSPSELRWPVASGAPHIVTSPFDQPKPMWTDDVPVTQRPAVLRVWRPDLEWSGEPWSPVAAVLQHLEALHLMVLAEQALDTSRLAGAGILFVPNSIAFPDQLGVDEARDVTNSPTFKRLARALIEPIGDRTNTDAVIPVVLTGPDEAGERIKHLLLERRDDPESWAKRRDSHLREIARAMDLPAGRVLNNDDQAKFANSSSMSDEVVEVYLPRFCDEIARAISERVFRPMLERWGVQAVHLRRLAPDYSDLTPDEDRTSEGLQLREAGVLSRKGLAKLARISDEDFMPDGSTEYQQWAIEQRFRGHAPQPVAPMPTGDWGALPPATAARILDAVEPPRLAAPDLGGVIAARVAAMDAEATQHLNARLAAMDAEAAVIARTAAPTALGKRLAKLGDQAIETGEKVNLADAASRLEGLGLDRADMPQLDGPRTKKFLDALEADGVTVGKPDGDADPLKYEASQSELSAKKAREISLADDLDEILSEPIIVSQDGYVLDGHHRWVAAIMAGTHLTTITVDLPIRELLDRAQEFSGRAKAFTAAAPQASPWTELARKLQAIDDRLAEGLTAAAEHALAAALAAAGRKVIARTKTAAVKERLATEPITHVVAAAGPAHVAAVGLHEDDLVRGAVDDLLPVADRLIEQAQTSAASLLGEAAPDAAVLAVWRARALELLGPKMIELAHTRLFDPSPAIDPRGEQPAVPRTVPRDITRQVMAAAGGTEHAPDVLPLGGTASGDGMISALTTGDQAPRAQWRWEHGDPLVPFPPHQDLDGKTFADSRSEDLNLPAGYEWVGYLQASPGDHNGCTCNLVLELA